MSILNFSHNLEDVILQGVFADIADGFFVDVGAGIPLRDSNTYALYRKGWRGLAVEPLPLGPLWKWFRPGDVFVQVAVGAAAGEVDLSLYESLQLSSAAQETVAHWSEHHRVPFRTLRVPVTTLGQICQAHRPHGEIHLLSIDVEGMEHAVLRGLDLARYRPWVIVLEATVPGTRVSNHQRWELLLLNARYMLAHNDGVNRYYLAQERQAQLGNRFVQPPPEASNAPKSPDDTAALFQEEEQLRGLLGQLIPTPAPLAALGTSEPNAADAEVAALFRCSKCGAVSAPVALRDFLRCGQCGTWLHLLSTRNRTLLALALAVGVGLTTWALIR